MYEHSCGKVRLLHVFRTIYGMGVWAFVSLLDQTYLIGGTKKDSKFFIIPSIKPNPDLMNKALWGRSKMTSPGGGGRGVRQIGD